LKGANQLRGQIPPEISQLTELVSIELQGNSLSGPIPEELGNLKKLEIISLGNNKLQGSLPISLSGLENLKTFHIENNLLTGTIPREYQHLRNLQDFHLENNQFTGQFPVEMMDIPHLTKEDVETDLQFETAIVNRSISAQGIVDYVSNSNPIILVSTLVLFGVAFIVITCTLIYCVRTRGRAAKQAKGKEVKEKLPKQRDKEDALYMEHPPYLMNPLESADLNYLQTEQYADDKVIDPITTKAMDPSHSKFNRKSMESLARMNQPSRHSNMLNHSIKTKIPQSLASGIPDRLYYFSYSQGIDEFVSILQYLFMSVNVPLLARKPFKPLQFGEIEVEVADELVIETHTIDGWCTGFNKTKGTIGIFPLYCTSPRYPACITLVHIGGGPSELSASIINACVAFPQLVSYRILDRMPSVSMLANLFLGAPHTSTCIVSGDEIFLNDIHEAFTKAVSEGVLIPPVDELVFE
jgi:hypothetical protein